MNLKTITKGFFKGLWKVYNIFALLLGHVVILGGICAGCYYLHKTNQLYWVLGGIILILLLIIFIFILYTKHLKK